MLEFINVGDMFRLAVPNELVKPHTNREEGGSIRASRPAAPGSNHGSDFFSCHDVSVITA